MNATKIETQKTWRNKMNEPNLALIVAIVGVGITIVGVMISMMFWVRQESNSLRNEAKDDRRELLQISRNLELAVNGMANEIKDFHTRLLHIENRR